MTQRAAADSYLRMDSGTKITSRIRRSRSASTATAFCSGQTSGGGSCGLVLPNSSRAAWVTDETGFQLAIVLQHRGKLLVGDERVREERDREDHHELALL